MSRRRSIRRCWTAGNTAWSGLNHIRATNFIYSKKARRNRPILPQLLNESVQDCPAPVFDNWLRFSLTNYPRLPEHFGQRLTPVSHNAFMGPMGLMGLMGQTFWTTQPLILDTDVQNVFGVAPSLWEGRFRTPSETDGSTTKHILDTLWASSSRGRHPSTTTADGAYGAQTFWTTQPLILDTDVQNVFGVAPSLWEGRFRTPSGTDDTTTKHILDTIWTIAQDRFSFVFTIHQLPFTIHILYISEILETL